MARKPKGNRRIDDPDNPELTMKDFRRARPVAQIMPQLIEAAKRARGRPKLARPKEHVTLRLDADVLAWFKRDGRRYQTRINAALRRVMEREMRAGK